MGMRVLGGGRAGQGTAWYQAGGSDAVGEVPSRRFLGPSAERRIRVLDLSKTRVNTMKKLKNEKELVKKAITIGTAYGERRGAVEFEPTDSAAEKMEYIYRLLVHDKLITPLPEEQVSQETIRHRLAMWAAKLTENR
jgi:hypothetical protein